MSYKWQGYIDYAFANDIPFVDLMEKAYQMGRTDQAKEDDELNYHYATSHDCWLKGRADALDEMITHIKACENEAYDNCEPLIGSVLMATRIKAEQLKEQEQQ